MAGLGPALNNKPLPGFAIRYQIRNGMGAMPAFDEEKISDKEAKNIVAYLKALRKLDKE
jgi:mono/diheme cytochrome c family protein